MEKQPDELRVLVAGAGPAGLLVAQILKKANVRCTVFEQDASPTSRPRDWNFGIYWAQSRLDECLTDDLRARLLTAQTVQSHKPVEDSVIPIYNGKSGEFMKNLPAPLSLRLHRRRFLKLLSTDVDIKYNKKLKSILRGESSVTITFEDGSEATGNLLISAEGAHSLTREFLLGEKEGALIHYPGVGNFTLCRISREAALALRAVHPRYVITFNPSGVFTWMSIHDCTSADAAEWTWMMMQTWDTKEDSGLSGKGKEEERAQDWIKKGEDFTSPFKEAFTTMDPTATVWHNRLGYWPTKPWDSGGLVTLMGDSAHPMTFHRGQGLNNAVTDAAELLQNILLMKERTPAELAAAVKRYEADLFPRGREAVLAGVENTSAVHDWSKVLNSPLFKEGLTREGDKTEVEMAADGKS